jgi:pimeloyl-ACP methyl ester carboxylesterase
MTTTTSNSAAARHPWRQEYTTLPVPTRTGIDASIGLLKIGNPNASTVLLLLGGKEGAAAGFVELGRNVAALAPDVAVWAMDRREAALADLTSAAAPLDEAIEYYQDGRYRRPDEAHFGEYAEWGLQVLVEDIRLAVAAAAEGGRTVILGGHSVGSAAAIHYAAWDFDGTAGYRGIDGLVVIDGGVLDAFRGAGIEFAIDLPTAQGWLAGIRAGGVFEVETSTSAGLGFAGAPETAAVFYKLAARAVLERPDEPSVLASRLPARYPVPESATNQQVFRALVDLDNASAGYGLTAATRLGVAAYAHSLGAGAFQWYTMNRVLLDYIAADSLQQTEITDLLGLRSVHGKTIDVPMLAYASGFTNGSAVESARLLVEQSAIPRLEVVTDAALTHHDLLFADQPANTLVRAIASFARSVGTRRASA